MRGRISFYFLPVASWVISSLNSFSEKNCEASLDELALLKTKHSPLKKEYFQTFLFGNFAYVQGHRASPGKTATTIPSKGTITSPTDPMGGEQCFSWLSYPENPVFFFNVPADHGCQNALRGTPKCPLIRIMKHLCLRLYLNAHKVSNDSAKDVKTVSYTTTVIIIPTQTMHKKQGEILQTRSTC